MKTVELLMLTRYSPNIASSRMRFSKLVPLLRPFGIDATVAQLLPDNYLIARDSGKAKFAGVLAARYVRRARDLHRARHADAILIQYEALPFVPWIGERLLYPARVPYILDLDDAWHLRYAEHRNPVVRAILGRKIDRIIAQARAVIVGSHELQSYAARLNESVHLVPTSVELGVTIEQGEEMPSNQVFTVGWIGSPATTPHLMSASESLARFLEETNSQMLVVGADPQPDVI